jgi:hypothetical protein
MSLNVFSGSCQPTVTAIILAPPKAPAASITAICNKLHKPPIGWGFGGVLIPTGRSAKTRGWWPHR